MEIIIAIVVFGFGLWWVFVRKPADTTAEINLVAPYKVETAPTPEPAPVVVVESAPAAAVEEVVVLAPVEAAVVTPMFVPPVKKPRKPRAPKVVAPVEKPAAKKAAPVKKAAAIKAAPKKPTTPRSKKA